jgi:hypothetical protein
VGEGVDVECEADVFLGGVEDVLAAGDAGVVDEDWEGLGCLMTSVRENMRRTCGIPNILSDLRNCECGGDS